MPRRCARRNRAATIDGVLRSRLTRREFALRSAFEMRSAEPVQLRSGKHNRRGAPGGGVAGQSIAWLVSSGEQERRNEAAAGTFSGEGELRPSTCIMPKKCLLFKKNLAEKNRGQSRAPKPRLSLAGDFFPQRHEGGAEFFVRHGGGPEFFGHHPKKVARRREEEETTEPGRALTLMSSAPGLRTPDSRLFWRGPQKSPFLAPQKSQKSRRGGGKRGRIGARAQTTGRLSRRGAKKVAAVAWLTSVRSACRLRGRIGGRRNWLAF